MARKPQVGDRVTTNKDQVAYHRDRTGKYVCFIPGDEGVIAVTNVPAVRGRERSFCCVDFYTNDRDEVSPNRAALWYEEIIYLDPVQPKDFINPDTVSYWYWKSETQEEFEARKASGQEGQDCVTFLGE